MTVDLQRRKERARRSAGDDRVIKIWDATTGQEAQSFRSRLASQAATLLRGKHKPQFALHVDVGDFVVVVNAEKVAVTGKKLDEKIYYRHSGYPGGLKERTLRVQLERQPTEVLRKAVKGMLPRNRLARW